jgi:hypothetical protein
MSNALTIGVTALATTGVVVGGIALWRWARGTTEHALAEHISVVANRENGLTEAERSEHIPLPGGHVVHTSIIFNMGVSDEGVGITLRHTGMVVTICYSRPDWHHCRALLIPMMTQLFFEQIQQWKTAAAPANEKTRRDIENHLHTLLD